MSNHALQSFFWPQSIAVLGASPDTHRIRGRLLHQLRENGYPGRILPINPSYQEIGGLRCYALIGAVGEPVDLALVAIPAAGVAPALEECARAGVKNALIISSGFAEEGGAARDMQAALVEVTKRTGIRACGPNCEGYFNALGKVATTFSPTVEVQEDESRVLVLYPVSDGQPGILRFDKGLRSALKARPATRVEIYNEYLDAARFPDEQHQKNLAEFLRGKYSARRPDVIIPGLAPSH